MSGPQPALRGLGGQGGVPDQQGVHGHLLQQGLQQLQQTQLQGHQQGWALRSLISTSDQLFSLCGLGQEGAVSEREEQELCQAKVQENLQTVLTWFCCTNNSRLILEEYHKKNISRRKQGQFLARKHIILNSLLVKVTFLLHFLLMEVSARAHHQHGGHIPCWRRPREETQGEKKFCQREL